MTEIEPSQVFEGRRYEIQLSDDEEEEVTIRLKSSNTAIIGMIGPLTEEEHPELFSGSVSQGAIDNSAKVIIQEILHAYNPLGFERNWSDDFPI